MATPTWIEYGERATGDNDPVYGVQGIVNRPAREAWNTFLAEHGIDGVHTAAALNPAGAMVMFGGASAPTGWLLCDGAAVSRTTYAILFAAIGTTWGVGDGSTTFNVPDLRGRAPIGSGQGSGLTNRTLGSKLGEESHALTLAENGSHAHTGGLHAHTGGLHTHTGGAHQHSLPSHIHEAGYTATYGGTGKLESTTGSTGSGGNVATSSNGNVATSSDGAVATTSSGSGTAHNTMQPSAVVNFIIKY